MKKTLLLIISTLLFLVSACSGTQTVLITDTSITENSTTTTTTTLSNPTEGLEVGNIAPDVTLLALDGSKHKLSDFRGQVVFLNFWASWCGPCRAEMPSMQKAYEKLKDEGFIILAVDVGEDKETVEDFMQEFALTFPAFLDEDRETYKAFNKTNGIPQTYIIDRNGIVRFYLSGSTDWSTISGMGKLIEILGIEND
ncbi:MAG: TlpA disulfide reductase family protein [Candidatus Spechtbacterales bacterium]